MQSAEKQVKPDPAPGKRKKGYDVEAAKNKVLEKVNSDLQQAIATSLGNALKECDAQKKKLQETYGNTEEAFFQDYVKLVTAREDLGKCLLNPASEEAVQKLIQTQRDQKTFCVSDVNDLISLPAEVDNMKQIVRSAATEDDIKQSIKSVKDSVGKMKRVVAAVSRATNDLKKAIEQKVKKAEADSAKKRKQQEAEKKKSEKEMQKKMKRAGAGEEKSMSGLLVKGLLSDLVSKKIPVFEVLADAKQEMKLNGSLYSGSPFIITSKATDVLRTEVERDAIKGFLQIFETQFPLSKQAREKHRVQSVMKVDSKLKELMLGFASSKCVPFKGGDDGANADMDTVSAYGFTGNMLYGGCEYQGLSALRFSCKGEREVALCSVADLWPIVSAACGDEVRAMSMEKPVTAFLAEKLLRAQFQDNWMVALLEKPEDQKKIFWKGVVPEGSMFFIPAGMILVERALNQKLGLGLRLSVQDSSEMSVRNLEKLIGVHMTYAVDSCRLAKRWQNVLSHAKHGEQPQG